MSIATHSIGAALLAGLLTLSLESAAAGAGTATASVASRGAYLATAGDCMACHTAKPAGAGSAAPAPFSGGLPMRSPFGIIYSTNITPDRDTGIGNYSLADFSRALRHGERRDGSRLYPAMPFASYAALTDADIADLYAYFEHEVAPVRHRPPVTALPFPFNQRWAMYFWDAAFVKHAVFQPHPDRSTQWNRGAYLVQTLGHCGSCHTPRGLAYQERGSDESAPLFLTGATVDDWYSADLTGNRAAGMGRRSEADLVHFLRHGSGAGDAVFGSMSEVVRDSTQHLTDDDLAAIAAYLKSLPAHAEVARYAPLVTAVSVTSSLPAGSNLPARERAGAGIYSGFCAKCHAESGAGNPGQFPALAGNPIVLSAKPTSLLRIVLEGATAPLPESHGSGAAKAEKMPAFATRLTDQQIADVVSFIRVSWGNAATPLTVRAVSELRETLQAHAVK